MKNQSFYEVEFESNSIFLIASNVSQAIKCSVLRQTVNQLPNEVTAVRKGGRFLFIGEKAPVLIPFSALKASEKRQLELVCS